jgi:hypothetical protein
MHSDGGELYAKLVAFDEIYIYVVQAKVWLTRT